MKVITLQEFINKPLKIVAESSFQDIRSKVVCRDGFSISIQASEFHYSSPRENGLKKYKSFELGYPSERDKLLDKYAENKDKPTDTVYGYVPFSVVNKLIKKHGGIKHE